MHAKIAVAVVLLALSPTLSPVAMGEPTCVDEAFVTFCADPPVPDAPEVEPLTTGSLGVIRVDGASVAVELNQTPIVAVGRTALAVDLDLAHEEAVTLHAIVILATPNRLLAATDEWIAFGEGVPLNGAVALVVDVPDAATFDATLTVHVDVRRGWDFRGSAAEDVALTVVTGPAPARFVKTDLRLDGTIGHVELSGDLAQVTLAPNVTLVSVGDHAKLQVTVDWEQAAQASEEDFAWERGTAVALSVRTPEAWLQRHFMLYLESCPCPLTQPSGETTVSLYIPSERLDAHDFVEVVVAGETYVAGWDWNWQSAVASGDVSVLTLR